MRRTLLLLSAFVLLTLTLPTCGPAGIVAIASSGGGGGGGGGTPTLTIASDPPVANWGGNIGICGRIEIKVTTNLDVELEVSELRSEIVPGNPREASVVVFLQPGTNDFSITAKSGEQSASLTGSATFTPDPNFTFGIESVHMTDKTAVLSWPKLTPNSTRFAIRWIEAVDTANQADPKKRDFASFADMPPAGEITAEAASGLVDRGTRWEWTIPNLKRSTWYYFGVRNLYEGCETRPVLAHTETDGGTVSHLERAVEIEPFVNRFTNGERVARATAPVLLDRDADGLKDLAFFRTDGQLVVVKNKGNIRNVGGFSEAVVNGKRLINPAVDGAPIRVIATEIDGDSRPDLVAISEKKLFIAAGDPGVNQNWGFKIQEDSRNNPLTKWNRDDMNRLFGANNFKEPFRDVGIGDFDGDGLEDIAVTAGDAAKPRMFFLFGTESRVGDGNRYANQSIFNWVAGGFRDLGDGEPFFVTADINADGITDTMRTARFNGFDYYEVWFWGSNRDRLGTVPNYSPVLRLTSNSSGPRQTIVKWDRCLLEDVNADGYPDIVTDWNHAGLRRKIVAHLNTGTTATPFLAQFYFEREVTEYADDDRKLPFRQIQIADFNSDGLEDLIYYGRSRAATARQDVFRFTGTRSNTTGLQDWVAFGDPGSTPQDQKSFAANWDSVQRPANRQTALMIGDINHDGIKDFIAVLDANRGSTITSIVSREVSPRCFMRELLRDSNGRAFQPCVNHNSFDLTQRINLGSSSLTKIQIGRFAGEASDLYLGIQDRKVAFHKGLVFKKQATGGFDLATTLTRDTNLATEVVLARVVDVGSYVGSPLRLGPSDDLSDIMYVDQKGYVGVLVNDRNTSTFQVVRSPSNPLTDTSGVDLSPAKLDEDGRKDCIVLDKKNKTVYLFATSGGDGSGRLQHDSTDANQTLQLNDVPKLLFVHDMDGNGLDDALIVTTDDAGVDSVHYAPIALRGLGKPRFLSRVTRRITAIDGLPEGSKVTSLGATNPAAPRFNEKRAQQIIAGTDQRKLVAFTVVGSQLVARTIDAAVQGTDMKIAVSEFTFDGHGDILLVANGDPTPGLLYNEVQGDSTKNWVFRGTNKFLSPPFPPFGGAGTFRDEILDITPTQLNADIYVDIAVLARSPGGDVRLSFWVARGQINRSDEK